MATTGEKIRIQRLTKNYSQEYMAFALSISQAAYSNLERDGTKLSLDRIYEIAEILEISPFILMPKPKFGTAINYGNFWRTINKFKIVWTSRIHERINMKPEL
jgi:transcriptional regulator with XRE-family HTH domain